MSALLLYHLFKSGISIDTHPGFRLHRWADIPIFFRVILFYKLSFEPPFNQLLFFSDFSLHVPLKAYGLGRLGVENSFEDDTPEVTFKLFVFLLVIKKCVMKAFTLNDALEAKNQIFGAIHTIGGTKSIFGF